MCETLLCCSYRYSKARDVFRGSLAVKDLPRAQWLLGDALFELGELSQAETHYQAVQIDGASQAERVHALQQLLGMYRRQGDNDKAASCSSQLHKVQAL